ncbi:transmembrane protein, putative [Bodo saltans]|uniref:Transmembrane protein, putative n=1 Tax=Bodo saltans TaxID=75058 RepID=A0A0S4JB01_BODSA|nr:transmembrane protein, putative [Bodo saltans]|eukprot:CUG87381.1 transmembrane protein, putative [Bodo saltans]
MLPALTSTIPSTTTSTTFLVAYVKSSSCVGVDGLLIVLGLLMIAVPIVALSHLAFGLARSWRCVAAPAREDATSQRPLTLLTRCVLRAMQRTWKWRVDNVDGETQRCAWVVLLEYRALWYAVADTLFLVAVSSLAVVAGLDVTNEALCRWCSATVVALLGALLGVLCVWRPYTTLFSLVYNVLTTALTCVSVAAQLAFVLTSFTSTSGLWLVDASAVCNLLVLGLSLVKMVLDAWDLWNALKRRWLALHGVERKGSPMESTLDEVNSIMKHVTAPFSEYSLSGPSCYSDDDVELLMREMNIVAKREDAPSTPRSSVSIEMERPHILDVMFWDDGGRAIGTSHAEDQNEILSTVVR